MPTRLAETELFWRGYWPPPYCEQRPGEHGEHAFDIYSREYVCAFCGGRVLRAEAQALEKWWQRFHWQTIVYERN